MKAGVLHAREDIRYEEVETPVPKAGEVLVKVKYSGICGSDVPRVNGDGAEVVHWFISDPFSTITRPCKELKHFEKQLIKAGETHIFRFEIDPIRDLGFVNANGEHFLENGEYYVIVKDQKVKFTVID